jgi:UDP-N-acetylmuramyl pentapeptide phosphotransferase/UDP-N-acetylglucosamine-1-phosphate transferase
VKIPVQLYAENFRGRRIPRILGIVLAAWAALGMAVLAAAAVEASESWSVFCAALLVSAAGLVDDLAPAGPRGLRGHLRALLSGRMTTGILKVLVTAGAAVVVVALLDRGDAVTRLGAVTLIAATTNVWNGLDVRPGRALKAFIVLMVGVVLAAAPPAPTGPIGAAVLSGAVLVLLPDLREWAMLGDAGANLLGFTAGVVLAGALPTWAMWPAAAVAVALNVVAETVTFSRVIDAVAPLRWFDRLGTRP